jgi:flavin reductase (DIM6/NTAB) family NADH-FMN oxidoreductase RutF
VTTSDTFDRLMTRLDPPMTIVTTVAGDQRAGCLVGFHSQAGMDPDTFAVWLSKANHTYAVAATAEHFAVHFLGAGDHDLARLFGTECGAEIDKFARCTWQSGPGGVPLLDRCPDRVVGTRHAVVDSGVDHVCFVLDPVEASTGSDPLTPLRLSDVDDLEPGHAADERRTGP